MNPTAQQEGEKVPACFIERHTRSFSLTHTYTFKLIVYGKSGPGGSSNKHLQELEYYTQPAISKLLSQCQIFTL